MPTAPPAPSPADNPELPLTGPQQGIWNAQRFDPESGRYLVGEVMEISGPDPIDIGLLAEAIRRTVAEAENMRTRFRDGDTGPVQVVTAAPAELRPPIDLRGTADPRALAHEAVALERHAAAERCRGMVDRQLYSYTLVRLTDREVWCVQLYHHLIVDGYSAAMLSRRIAAHYTALRRGKPAPKRTFGTLAALVAEEREYRAGDGFALDRAYWRDRLSPWPNLDGRGSHVGGAVERTVRAEAVLDAEAVTALRECAERYGITWADVLVACYAAFLHRQLGTTDVVLSVLLMNRMGRAALTTPAMAVNVLPLRITVHPGDRISELGPRTALALTEIRAHQRYSGNDLARDFPGYGAAELLHGAGINLKIFDVALNFDGARGVLRNVAGGPPEDLGLTVTPLPEDRLLLGFECDARTNDPAAAHRRIAALARVVSGFTGSDKVPVGALTLLDRTESARVLAQRAGPDALTGPAVRTRRSGPPGREATGVPAALERLAAERPSAVVLTADGTRWTAAELGSRVNRLVRLLWDRDVRPGDVVAIALPPVPEFVAALFAVWRAGAVALPLDPEYPQARLRATLRDAAPVLVLDDAIGDALDQYSDAPLPIRHPDPGSPAQLIYTSGSTGEPKGVLVSHGALAALLAAHRAQLFAGADRPLTVAHTTSFAFDAALDPLFWLLDGHRVHLYDSALRRDPRALAEAFRRDGVQVVDGTPALIGALLEHGLAGAAPELVVLGGEACSPALWRGLRAAGLPARNLYGPTEATVDVLGAVVDGELPHIGRPLPGSRVYLLDNGLQPVPDDTVGELYLAGPQLALGYRGRAAATAERFVPDPYGPPGTRMYRTGDRARWVPGRGYAYVGRADGQVKIRGHRVELGEVEAALGALPGVRAAAADVREIAGRPVLIGWVVPGDPDTPIAALRAELAERVPDALVPARLVAVDALPRTVNGKLDRAALPAPPGDGGGRAPSGPAEHLVCEVVADVLGATPDPDDDFFGAGGDSIGAITVCARLRERGLLLAPQQLLSRRSLATLAATAEPVPGAEPERRPEPPPVPVPAALTAIHGPVAAVLRLSPLQEGLLFHALRDGDADIYTMTARFGLIGPAEPDRLGAAFARVIARHPNLGAGFHYAEFDHPVQAVPRDPRVSWRVLDLRGHADPHAAAEAAERTAGAEPFDIARPPLLRALLVRTADTAQRLILVAHHLLADGWSVPLILRETLALYHGDPLPDPASYARYTEWLAGREADAALAHWQRHLAGLTGPSLIGRAGHRAPTVGSEVALAPEVPSALEALGRTHGLTLNTLVQAAWALVLADHLGRPDVVFGAVVSGRPAELADVERMVGLFSNTVPVRLALRPEQPLPAQLSAFQDAALELQRHGYLDLATVERAAGQGRLFDTLVVFENFPRTGIRQPDSHDLRVDAVAVHSRTHFPITVTALPGERFTLLLHHDPAAVPAPIADRLARRLAAVMAALATAGTRSTVAELTAAALPADLTGATLADWGTAIDPATPALTGDGATLSYREFDARAHRLARWLIGRGVGPETVVAVAMERGIEAVVAAHAVSRAGGVYLPIDPAQPAARVGAVLDAAAPRLVLTTAADGFGTDRAPVLAVDDLALSGFAATPITDAERIAPLRPDNAAYLLFTSGSTGVPKGVAVSHAAIVATFAWLYRRHRFGPDDTVLYRTPATFDASLLELYLPLLVGARVVLARRDGHRDPFYQAELIRAERVSTVQFTASMLTALAEEGDLTGCEALRCVLTGGEPLPPGTARRMRERTGTGVDNLYGPTEAAVCITYHETVDADQSSVPIGRPATGSGVRVLDDALRPVPAGVVGALYLTGVQLARGYLGRPGQTAGTFVADPHGSGARMYRTGDLVRWNGTGELDYIGRADSQVKLRGQRIELGEIEVALTGCAGVAQAAVLLREDSPGDQRLVAYLIAAAGAELDIARVREQVRELLPAYMVPAAFVVLDRIPRTASEKIDRKALPAPGPDTPGSPPEVRPPAGSTAPPPGAQTVPSAEAATCVQEAPGSQATPGAQAATCVQEAPGSQATPGAQAATCVQEAPGSQATPGAQAATCVQEAPGSQATPGAQPAVGGQTAVGGRTAVGGQAAIRGQAGARGQAGTRAPAALGGTAASRAGAAAASGATVERVRAAMAAVLARPELGPDEDFFAAGGHSLTAVRLTGRLRRDELPITLDDVFAAPTARALAARVRGGDGGNGFGTRLDHVLPLREQGTAEPLFCVHPIGGTAWQFTPLARELRADRPLIGLQFPGLGASSSPATNLNDLAEHYVRTVRERQPHGPYHLLGYSLGGNIVHAMAAALTAAGERVAFAGLIDAHPLAQLIAHPPGSLDELLPDIPDDAPELAATVRAAATTLLGLVAASHPPAHRGPFALYAAGAPEDGRADAQLAGWRKAGAEITARRLPYTHLGIVSADGWREVAALLDADPAIRTGA